MKIWCLRSKRVNIERRENRFRALRDVWSHHDFRIFGREDVPAMRKHEPEILMVFGHEASRSARTANLKAKYKVYFPSFWLGRLRAELPEVRSDYYQLILAEDTMWLDEFRKVHSCIHYVDRGFDPMIFQPDWNAKKRWDVAFIGNPDGFGRQRRLDKLEAAFPGRVLNTKGINHAGIAWTLQRARIGWNQIFSPGDALGSNYRVWEVLGSGALLLTNATNEIRAVLKDRIHAIFWRDDNEMLELADYYIRRWDDRGLRIAKRGCKLAHAKHTWAHRAQEIRLLIGRYYGRGRNLGSKQSSSPHRSPIITQKEGPYKKRGPVIHVPHINGKM